MAVTVISVMSDSFSATLAGAAGAGTAASAGSPADAASAAVVAIAGAASTPSISSAARQLLSVRLNMSIAPRLLRVYHARKYVASGSLLVVPMLSSSSLHCWNAAAKPTLRQHARASVAPGGGRQLSTHVTYDPDTPNPIDSSNPLPGFPDLVCS